jgi:hypothetical protein
MPLMLRESSTEFPTDYPLKMPIGRATGTVAGPSNP